MRECPHCGSSFSLEGYQCPHCKQQPIMIDDFPVFALELARMSDGFEPGSHEKLVQLESGCFWFRRRNKLLQLVLDQYFPDAQSFLEIGCGTGFVLDGFSHVRPGMRLVGAEIYLSGLKLAKKRVPQAELIQMEAGYVPFRNEFDVVGAFDVLEHIDDDLSALSQIFKSVKPMGGILLTVPQHRWLWSAKDDSACHKRRYTRHELKTKVETVGFKVLWMTSFVTVLLPFMYFSRLLFSLARSKMNKSLSPQFDLRMPFLLDVAFEIVCAFEHIILRHGFSLPLGASLLCVGVKE